MEEFKFTAEMFFDGCDEEGCTKEHETLLSDKEIANIANAKLKEYLDKCPTVYGTHDKILWSTMLKGTGPQAKLFNIKTITEG